MPESIGQTVPREFLKLALSLTQISAEIINEAFLSTRLRVDEKSDHTPVTQADRNAEETMRNAIRKNFPSHGIIGEEFGEEKGDAEWVWVLDPIDGTLAFIHGVPLFTTLIGLLNKGVPLLGIIYQPTQNLLCHNDGDACFLNNQTVRCAAPVSLQHCLLLCTDFENVERHRSMQSLRFKEVCSRVKISRTWADGYGYLLLASGRAHIMCDPVLNAWDVLPVIPIVRASGAIITGWDGREGTKLDGAIAAPPDIHKEVMRYLNCA
jgi:histidinol phosphatase-like enzyme (inositol monophosphatase family)